MKKSNRIGIIMVAQTGVGWAVTTFTANSKKTPRRNLYFQDRKNFRTLKAAQQYARAQMRKKRTRSPYQYYYAGAGAP